MKKRKLQNWQPANVDYNNFTSEDFATFGGIEELTDYEVVKASNKRKIRRSQSEEGVPGPISEKKRKSSTLEEKRTGPTSEEKRKKKKRNKVRKSNLDVDTPPADFDSKCSSEKTDMSAWCNLHVPDEILAVLESLGFYTPTEIQALTLPSAIRDHLDILAAAETGSGKTLAFGIPVITHIMATQAREQAEEQSSGNTLKALVLTPTRELAIQVKNHMQAITKHVNIKLITIVGGMSQEKQRRLLQKSPDIIVATPGRLWQLMEEGEPYLEQVPFVRYLIIDEADRMVEQGHYEELTKLLEIMNKNKKAKRRQNFVFSATLTMVHDMPKRFDLKKKSKYVEKHKLESLMTMIGIKDKPKIVDITRKAGVVETLTESQLMCSMEEKDTYLYYFVTMYPGRTLVFCNSISSVRRLKSILEHLQCNPLTLHASMQQRQRFKNLERFAASEKSLLLATDVAARGLDIKGIEHVVHFQVPRTAEIYVHRSGRTARAQNEGLSLMLVEPQEAVCYKKICKTLNRNQSLTLFPVDNAVYKVVKERVALARLIDKHEHREQRLVAQNRWFLKAAEDMDVEMDDKDLLNELGSKHEQAMKAQRLKSMKNQLKSMLSQRVVARTLMGSYPTKSGKLLLPKECGTQKALNVVQHSTKNSSRRNKKS